MEQQSYISPLVNRYAGQSMLYLFSPQYKYSTWRKLWIALATSQRNTGLKISNEQIQELENHIEDIDFDLVRKYEKELRHEVMAHIHAYGDLCPLARPIIHLGATSCYVTDNGNLIQFKEALILIQAKLIQVIRYLVHFIRKYARQPCLAYTHFQPAQPTTLGKRACMWLQDFLMDLNDLNQRIESLPFLGVKGTTGTQAAFLSLFENNHAKVKNLDREVAKAFNFSKLLRISGQTYPRKIDVQILELLSGISVSAHKFSTDFRLMAHLNEMDESAEDKQIGSSAMPYKNNPIRTERICSLGRFIISLSENPKYTAANQWFERTLDDSANQRLCMSESFLATDSILNLLMRVISDVSVYPGVIERHLSKELPFIATENILMAAVKKGGDRQLIHERLRQHARNAQRRIKESDRGNDLLERIINDASISISKKELENLLNIDNFIGRAPQQVEEFLQDEVRPILEKYEHIRVPLEEIPV